MQNQFFLFSNNCGLFIRHCWEFFLVWQW